MNKKVFYSSMHKTVLDNCKQNGDQILFYSKSNQLQDIKNIIKYHSRTLGTFYKLQEKLPVIRDKANIKTKNKIEKNKAERLNRLDPSRENQEKDVSFKLPQKDHILLSYKSKDDKLYRSSNFYRNFSKILTNELVPVNLIRKRNEHSTDDLNINSFKNTDLTAEKAISKRPRIRKKRSWDMQFYKEVKQKGYSKQLVLEGLNSSIQIISFLDPELRSCDLKYQSDDQVILDYIKVNDLLSESKLKDIQTWIENINLKENVDANRFLYNSSTQWFECQ